jgi:MFS family permease
MINFGRNGVVLIANFFLIEKFSITDFELGLFESGLSIAIIFGGLVTPLLIRQVGDWKVFFLTALLAVVSLISFVNVPILVLAFVFGASLWIAHVTIESTSYGIVSSIIPAEVRGKYFGYYNTTFFLSWGLGGTFLTGPIADFFISSGLTAVVAYSYAFYAAALLVFAGIIFGLLLYNKKESYLLRGSLNTSNLE